jgi:hypothetical protein
LFNKQALMSEEVLEDIDDKLVGLGEPIAQFSVGKRAIVRNAVIAPAFFLAGVALVAGLLWRHAWGHSHFIVMGISLIVMGVMVLVRGVRNRGLRVLIFPEGFMRISRGEGQAFFWDEIDRIWRKKTEGHWARAWQGSLVLRIERKDGRSMEFDDTLPRLGDLAAVLHQQSLPHMLPAALNDYDSGRTLDFGKLKVNQTGIRHDADALGWKDIQELKFDEDRVTIHKKGRWGKWKQVTLSEIPNAHLLRALLVRTGVTRVTSS